MHLHIREAPSVCLALSQGHEKIGKIPLATLDPAKKQGEADAWERELVLSPGP